jgi:alkanesulfonate monooxygenase SsuD/methylene tetrahydromethanopterin reductase-like flavin-dependent oxidoreductase (luciferase family)
VISGLPELGLRLPNSGPFAEAGAILRIADVAERLAYDTVWVHDHVSWPRHQLTHFATGSLEACVDQDPNFYESLVTLGVLGGRLRTVGLGVAGLVLPLRDPRVLGKQLAALDRLTDGRVIIGMGSGAMEHDFEIMGVPWTERGKIMNEYLEALAVMFGPEQPVSHAGPRAPFSDGTFYPRPKGLRIWVAGRSPASMKRAARYGDGWLTHVLAPDEYAVLYSDLVRRLDNAGKDPASFDTSLELFACIAKTHEEAVAISRKSLTRRAEDQVAANLVGTAEEVCAKLVDYRRAGVSHVELRMICHSVDQLEEMAERVAKTAGLAKRLKSLP